MLFFLISILSCSGQDSTPEELNSEANLISFQIDQLEEVETDIDLLNRVVNITLAPQSDVTDLVAVFEISQGSIVKVNGIIQESGITSNDFSDDVIYTITSEDKSVSLDWVVSIKVLEPFPFIVSTFVDDFPGNDGISVDDQGNLFVNSNGLVNQFNGKAVYKVDLDGQFRLFADNLKEFPVGSVFDSNGNLYVTGWKAPGYILKITPDGTVSELTSGILDASGLEFDNDGLLYAMEPRLNRMIRVSATGEKTVFASGASFNYSSGIAYNPSQNVFYVSNWNDGKISVVDSKGHVEEFISLPSNNLGPLIYANDHIYVTSPKEHKIFVITVSTKSHSLLAGSGNVGHEDGPGDKATFNAPTGIAISKNEKTIYVSEISPSGAGRIRTIKRLD